MLLQQVTLNDVDGPATNISLDPTETFLYALAGRAIRVLNLDTGGMLSETISPVALPGLTLETPLCLAAIRK